MRYKLLILFCALFISTSLFANEQLPFKDGEKLELSLKWMGIVGGRSTIEVNPAPRALERGFTGGGVKEKSGVGEKESYILTAGLRTAGLADILFKIRDKFASEVMIDSDKISPSWWDVVKKEKNYEYQKKTVFANMLKDEPDIQNPLSALFLFRMQEWQAGDSITVPVFMHEKVYPIKVTAVSKEPLSIYGEEFNTTLIDVAVETTGVEVSSAELRDFKIWLTDDEKRLPIFIKADTSIGTVNVILDNREDFYKDEEKPQQGNKGYI
jgi:hypothetical protein